MSTYELSHEHAERTTRLMYCLICLHRPGLLKEKRDLSLNKRDLSLTKGGLSLKSRGYSPTKRDLSSRRRGLSPTKRVLSDRTASLEFRLRSLSQKVYSLDNYLKGLALTNDSQGVDCTTVRRWARGCQGIFARTTTTPSLPNNLISAVCR